MSSPVSPRGSDASQLGPSESRWREVGMVRMVGRRLGLWGWERVRSNASLSRMSSWVVKAVGEEEPFPLAL